MSDKRPVVIKSATELKNLFDRVRIGRLKNGKNNTLLSYTRLTLAMARIPNLEKTLMEANIDDKK